MKKGMRILNFARGGLVNSQDLIKAIDSGIVERYVTDFPDAVVIDHPQVIALPHLGSSTPEAENNCASMAAEQLKGFLETGNITNSVNYPNCSMPVSSACRIVIANRNIPNMLGQISTKLADEKINITNMLNRNRGDIAYTIIDVEDPISSALSDELKNINGVLMVRVIDTPQGAK